MHTKKDASFVSIVALSMLILAYLTFVTVYEQILSQNNGFFNVIIFGVVLILVFIFITLIARIITVKTDSADSSPVLRILITVGIFAIFALFVFLRLKYTSSISPGDYKLYKAAEYISNGNLMEAKDIHSHLISYPQDFVYGFVISYVFSITGASTEIYILINIFMMLLLSAFLYLNVNLISGKAYATVAVIVFMFMPNNSFLVYSYNSELFVAAFFMIALYLYQLLIYRRFKSSSTGRILALLCGIASGFCISCEPVLLLAFMVLSIWVILAKRQNVICAILPLIFSIVLMLVFSFLKSLMMGIDFLEVIIGQCLCFVPTYVRDVGADDITFLGFFDSLCSRLNNPSRFLDDNFYFLTDSSGKSVSTNQAIWLKLADQLIYIFLLVLCVLCIVYILRVAYDKIIPAFSLLIVLFLGQLLGGTNSVSYVYFITVIVMIASTTIYYMYLNHHPDYAVYITNMQIKKDNEILLMSQGYDVSDEENEAETTVADISNEDIARARALIFVGENEGLYQQIKEEERLNRINNPIAATRIKTSINDEGEYDSVEESVEFLDDLDEKVEAKPVHEVKAIPASRPVEVVKPVLADDYNVELTNDTVAPVTLEYKEPEPEFKTNVQPEGFVFRKKDSDSDVNKNTGKNKEIKVKEVKVKETKAKEPKVKDTKAKVSKVMASKNKLEDIKPGEPLPNPLPLPKPHVNKDLDFDLDIDTNDDFDY